MVFLKYVGIYFAKAISVIFFSWSNVNQFEGIPNIKSTSNVLQLKKITKVNYFTQ